MNRGRSPSAALHPFLPRYMRSMPILPLRLAAFGLLAALLHTTPVFAQAEFGRVENLNTNANTYYFFVRPATATIQVYVLGSVRAPGIYEVSEGTTLGSLVALSGGPLSQSRLESREVKSTLRVFRTQGGTRTLIFEKPVENAFDEGNAVPTLLHGDIVVVEVIERQRFTWRDITQLVTTAGVMALAIERLTRVL